MNLTLLAPLFLLGLAGLAVPVIVHLIHRHKRDPKPFPSLMFIQRIPYKDIRRQQLRHKFLFALRCLALLLLVFAFTRPFFETSAEAAAVVVGGREVVILMDRSHSMRYGDRWTRAVAQAHARVDALGPADRASLVLFAERAEATGQPTADMTALSAAIDAAETTAGGTRYGPALQLAGRILSESDRPEREVVLITDFQRAGWDGISDVRMPSGTLVTPVDLSERDSDNLWVPFVALKQDVTGGQERVSVSARVVNGGNRRVQGLRVSLTLNGQEVQQRQVDVDPISSAAVAFSPVLMPLGLSRGTVTAGTDLLPQDNVFSFVLTSSNSLSALILESSTTRENQSLYLSRALSIGDRPSFRVDVRQLRQFRLSDLDGRALLVLNDAPFPSGRAGQRIRDFVENGGGLLVVLGERNGPGTWPAEGASLLPGVVADRMEPERGAVALTTMDYGSPVFDVFRAPHSGDFSTAKFFRYRDLHVTDPHSVLARFSNGAPALAQQAVGRGMVLVWTTTVDTYWNDFALQPVFLPAVHRMARHLSGYREVPSAFTVGEPLELSRESPDPLLRTLFESGEDLVVESPSGRRQVLRATEAAPVVELAEQGFYGVRQLEAGDLTPTVLAANLEPVESDLTTLDTDAFLGAVTPLDAETGTAVQAATLTIEERERRQQLWWYLLIAALLILAAETTVSNRLSRVAR